MVLCYQYGSLDMFILSILFDSQAEVTRIQIGRPETIQDTTLHSHISQRPQLPEVIPSIQVPANSWSLLSYNSGQMLTIAMTLMKIPSSKHDQIADFLYTILQAIKQNRMHLDDIVTISSKIESAQIQMVSNLLSKLL